MPCLVPRARGMAAYVRDGMQPYHVSRWYAAIPRVEMVCSHTTCRDGMQPYHVSRWYAAIPRVEMVCSHHVPRYGMPRSISPIQI